VAFAADMVAPNPLGVGVLSTVTPAPELLFPPLSTQAVVHMDNSKMAVNSMSVASFFIHIFLKTIQYA
jgi:hypothetical protein